MPRLVISRPGQPVREVALAGEISIGRHPDNVISLSDALVSGRHARICVEDDAAWVEDLGSVNGTIVDGRVVPPAAHLPLVGGEHVSIGPFVLTYAADTVFDRTAPLDGDDDILPPRRPRHSRTEKQVVRKMQVAALVSLLVALAAVVVRQLV